MDIGTLIAAAKEGDDSRVRALIAAHPGLKSARLPSGESPIMAALYRGHLHVVDTLVELGTELDLFASAATGHLEGLRRALQQPGAVNAFAYDGWTPLHLAAFFGQLDAARLLLDAGADVEAVSHNGMRNTPLHAATAGKHEPIALLLLQRGANPHVLDAGGFSARRIADENQLSQVVAWLEARPGARPASKDG